MPLFGDCHLQSGLAPLPVFAARGRDFLPLLVPAQPHPDDPAGVPAEGRNIEPGRNALCERHRADKALRAIHQRPDVLEIRTRVLERLADQVRGAGDGKGDVHGCVLGQNAQPFRGSSLRHGGAGCRGPSGPRSKRPGSAGAGAVGSSARPFSMTRSMSPPRNRFRSRPRQRSPMSIPSQASPTADDRGGAPRHRVRASGPESESSIRSVTSKPLSLRRFWIPRTRSRTRPSWMRSGVSSGSRATVREPSLITFRFSFSILWISTPSGVRVKALSPTDSSTPLPPEKSVDV